MSTLPYRGVADRREPDQSIANKTTIKNFGGNVEFQPRHRYQPTSETAVLNILAKHRGEQIRVLGAGHSWTPLIATDDVLVDMRHFDHVEVVESVHAGDADGPSGGPVVRVGAGCRIKDLLRALDQHGLTLPSIGLITEQSIAGAAVTGTHGSGRHCLSQYVVAARIACYDERGGELTPRIVEVSSGDELRAVRCSLGRLGVITELTIQCVPRYYVEERVVWGDTFEEMRSAERDWPLQQFFLIPHAWRYIAQRRRVAEDNTRRGFAAAYHVYFIVAIDVCLHVLIKLFKRSAGFVRLLYRQIFPRFVITGWGTTDRSDRQLTMKHHWFRHFELELFVQAGDAAKCSELVTDMLMFADDRAHEPSESTRDAIESADLSDAFAGIGSTYSHHYPICIRRVLADDTLIAMTSRAAGAAEGTTDWYAFSFITYRQPTDDFEATIGLLARVAAYQFGARMHWGKWSPLSHEVAAATYPEMQTFEAICRRLDPEGSFSGLARVARS